MDKIIKDLFNDQLDLENHLGVENNAEIYEGKYNNNSKIVKERAK